MKDLNELYEWQLRDIYYLCKQFADIFEKKWENKAFNDEEGED